jgi:predicted nucleic acid-binding protein
MIGIADTSILIAWETGRQLRAEPPEEIAVTVITLGELRLGVLLADGIEPRHRRLATLQLASSLEPIGIDQRVADAWAALVASLRQDGHRMPINDSWIAAVAMAHEMPVVTQDDDFDAVVGLRVIKL